MDAERWAEIRALFDELVDLAPSARTERLERVGVSDPDLKRAVADLLTSDAEADQRLGSLEAPTPLPLLTPKSARIPSGWADRRYRTSA